jgi:hypothetical protein
MEIIMSTRSTISYKDKEGNYRSVYCHWDGYTDHVGKVLVQNYNTYEKIEELCSYGDMSILDLSVEDCVFYSRDKGEVFRLPKKSIDLKQLDNISEEYLYVFEDGKWNCWCYGDREDLSQYEAKDSELLEKIKQLENSLELVEWQITAMFEARQSFTKEIKELKNQLKGE